MRLDRVAGVEQQIEYHLCVHLDLSKLFVYISRYDSNICLARDEAVLCDGQIAPITIGDFETGGDAIDAIERGRAPRGFVLPTFEQTGSTGS